MTSTTALKAAIVATMIGTVASPAFAGGQISISVAPGSADQEQVMRLGLGIYALANGFKNGGIKQKGFGNVAGLLQNGGGNLGALGLPGLHERAHARQHLPQRRQAFRSGITAQAGEFRAPFQPL